VPIPAVNVDSSCGQEPRQQMMSSTAVDWLFPDDAFGSGLQQAAFATQQIGTNELRNLAVGVGENANLAGTGAGSGFYPGASFPYQFSPELLISSPSSTNSTT
jgi:hypothetical protein